MYNNEYPSFDLKTNRLYHNFSYDINLDYLLQDYDELDIYSVNRNIYCKDNIFSAKKLIGQYVTITTHNDDSSINFDLYISERELSKSYALSHFNETSLIAIDGTLISLEQIESEDNCVTYFFKFKKDNQYIFGYIGYQSDIEFLYVDKDSEVQFMNNFLKRIFF